MQLVKESLPVGCRTFRTSLTVRDRVSQTAARRWGNADGIACIQMLQPRTYAPLEVVTESSTWDQRDSGAQVPRGSLQ